MCSEARLCLCDRFMLIPQLVSAMTAARSRLYNVQSFTGNGSTVTSISILRIATDYTGNHRPLSGASLGYVAHSRVHRRKERLARAAQLATRPSNRPLHVDL